MALIMLSFIVRSDPQVTLTSDASGGWGCGAYCGDDWFQLQWEGPTADGRLPHYNQGAYPHSGSRSIVGAGTTVQAKWDNARVVGIINQGSSKDQDAMHLMRCLAFVAAKFQFSMVASHLRLADALSRDRLLLFRSHNPQAQPHPAMIPPELLVLLLVTKPD